MAVLALVVLVAMGSALWRYVEDDGPSAVLRLTDVRGDVKVGRSAEGVVAAEEGLELRRDDRVSTGTDARAVLTLGPSTHIRLGPTSSLEVVEVDASAVSLELQDGRLHATVRPDSGAVRVGNRGRSVVATSGAFDVGVDGDVMQVSATEGSLSLSGVDATRLDAGEQATVVERHADVGPASEELLLAVQWPTEARTRAESTLVEGTTRAGARVRLRWEAGEVEVHADQTGRFQASIPLDEGENPLTVDAEDALGNHAADNGELQVRDTTGPAFRGGVEYER
jgi:FecR protein/Glucodextranase, domain B